MRITPAFLATLSAFGCAPSPGTGGSQHYPSLVGAWRVEDVDHAGIIEGAELNVDFGEDGGISGRSACNRFGGEYLYLSGVLTIKALFSTRMACAPALMDLEAKFLDRLEGTLKVQPDADGALSLEDGGGRILIRQAR